MKFRQPLLFLYCLGLIIFSACKTVKPSRPMEYYEKLFEEGVSVVNIPVRIDEKDLERLLNQQMSDVLYEDMDLKDGDDMMIRAEKKEDITIRLDSSLFKYRVPLSLWIRYDAGIAKVEADAVIALNFNTAFSIGQDWALSTNTGIESYEWLEKPRLRMGVINLPVGFIGDMLLKKFRSTITRSIDEQIAANLDLKTMVADAWKRMFDPILVSEEYSTWLLINPGRISMTPLRVQQNMLSSTIMVESKPKVSFGAKPQAPSAVGLPPFHYAEQAGEDFQIRVGTEISYDEAERLVKKMIAGERYEYGNKYVIVEDIELYGQGNNLVVNTRLSGTFNGNIYMTGKPEFNPGRNAVDVKNLKYTVESRNFLLRSAAWLLRSKFRNAIQENLDFYLDQNLSDIRQQIQEQLSNYAISDNVGLNGELTELNIANAYLAPDAIRVDLLLKGRINVNLIGLKEAGKP